jgi:two-component system, chemotaxis family, response regulator PixG
MIIKKAGITVQLISLQQERFTGKIDLRSPNSLHWKLYFFLGRLVWAEGGCHPHRSWERHITKYCPQINLKTICLRDLDRFECQNYQMLTNWLHKKLVKPEQVKALVESSVTEALFDILQQEAIDSLDCTIESASDSPALASVLKTSPALINIEYALQEAEESWSFWVEMGCMSWSLNLAPTIKHPEKLQQEVAEAIYQNFVKLIDGNTTLRDLAFNLNKEAIKLAHSIIPFIHKEFLELVEIPDIESPITVIKCPTNFSQNQNLLIREGRSIACIDDSPQICQVMEQIVTKAGYRFIGIQEPLQVIPKLIAINPDLIFLDIGMPIVNGYEICSQLRRISKFKETPVIILTGRDGLIDKMRAKVSGASDFVSKPIDVEEIVNIIEKFLSVPLIDKSNQTLIRESQMNPKFKPA